MEVRKTTIDDLGSILQIYSFAREYMKETGNPNQWKDNRPEREVVIGDIENGNSYAIEHNAEICGVFAFIIGQDLTYNFIQGQWLNDEPYGTIHRIASNNKVKGVLNCCLRFCQSKTNNIRIDTHKDNLIMQHLLEKDGFTKCGIIYLQDGSPRIAYQRDFKTHCCLFP